MGLVLLKSKTCAEVVNIVKVIFNLSTSLDSNDWSKTFLFYRLPVVILLPVKTLGALRKNLSAFFFSKLNQLSNAISEEHVMHLLELQPLPFFSLIMSLRP